MGFELNKLSAREVQHKTKPGRYGDGGGLWLQIAPSGSKSWLFRYQIGGKARQMGLGPTHAVPLAAAREKATAARRSLVEGIDPLSAKQKVKQAQILEAAKSVTFEKCAMDYIAAHESSWKNPKHRQQWESTLRTYAFPVIGALPVADIDTSSVLRCVQPIWQQKTETAARTRMRIETVLAYATAAGYRQGENPARWTGHMDQMLPSRKKAQKVVHHPALPYREVGVFMTDLRTQEGVAARCLEFLILTACRTGEAIGAKIEEFDLDNAMWIIPKERMKAGREHRVALSTRALEIIKSSISDSDFVFPGGKSGAPLSNMAMNKLLKRMKQDQITVHGFRSTFRDWCAEMTNHPNELAELALAHAVGDKTEAAYRRGDQFEKRIRLAEDWARYCGRAKPDTAEVVSLRIKTQ